MTEFILRRNLVATRIDSPGGKPVSAAGETLGTGTVGRINGGPYECLDTDPPATCIDLLIDGKLYRVAHRSFKNASTKPSKAPTEPPEPMGK